MCSVPAFGGAGEPDRLFCPGPADRLVGRQALQRLLATGIVVGVNKAGEMRPRLVVILLVEALRRGVRDGAVHPLDLAVGPEMLGPARGLQAHPCRARDVKVAERVALELAPHRPVTIHLGSPRQAVALQTAVQRRAGQVRQARLQGIQAVVERQQRVAAIGDDDRFDRRRRRGWCLGPRWPVGDGGPYLSLGDRLWVDAVASGQSPQALLTMLYRSTDRRCPYGAPVENPAHSVSSPSGE